jgi:UDP-N-acetylmuramoyl-L-alanyl-D-glutamate--2,6-diaminopimelate ligase
MLLSDILTRLKRGKGNTEFFCKCYGISPRNIEISEVTSYSKDCAKDSVFVCIKGEKHDGNEFLGEALKCGARVFVSERCDLKIKSGILIISKNARKTMAEMSKIVYEIPHRALLKIGITGTKGKSTVCELISVSLRKLGIKTLSIGTLGAYIDESVETKNTTPESNVIFSLMKKAYTSGARVAVIELSSQALSSFRAWGMDFDIAVFTSFGKDHIGEGEHKSFCDYVLAKRSLFTSYGVASCVVNYDDAFSPYFSSGVREIIKCGFQRGADYKIARLREGFFGMRFFLSGIEKSYSLTGGFNAVNIALAAATVQKITGFELEKILDTMKNIRVKGRFECYAIRSRFVIIDYAHNEKSFKELLGAVKRLTKSKLISVFGSVGERSLDRRRELAKAASSLSDFSVITADNPGLESAYEIAEEIYSYFPEKSRAKICEERGDAIREAFLSSNRGDVILLLGKGHEEFMLEGGRRIKFSERELLFKIKNDREFHIPN